MLFFHKSKKSAMTFAFTLMLADVFRVSLWFSKWGLWDCLLSEIRWPVRNLRSKWRIGYSTVHLCACVWVSRYVKKYYDLGSPSSTPPALSLTALSKFYLQRWRSLLYKQTSNYFFCTEHWFMILVLLQHLTHFHMSYFSSRTKYGKWNHM